MLFRSHPAFHCVGVESYWITDFFQKKKKRGRFSTSLARRCTCLDTMIRRSGNICVDNFSISTIPSPNHSLLWIARGRNTTQHPFNIRDICCQLEFSKRSQNYSFLKFTQSPPLLSYPFVFSPVNPIIINACDVFMSMF